MTDHPAARIPLIHAWQTSASLMEWRRRAEAAGQPLTSMEAEAYQRHLHSLMTKERGHK